MPDESGNVYVLHGGYRIDNAILKPDDPAPLIN
jgi:aminoglycoside phosphotransferase (APT) family kinase protein